MDILCLMGLFPDEYRQEIQKNSIQGIQNAADKLQRSIVKGLASIDDMHIQIANSLYIGSYPRRYRKLMIPSFEFSMFGKVTGTNIGFCNLAGLKNSFRYNTAKKVVKKWAETDSGEEKALIIYALTGAFTRIAHYVTIKHKNIKVCIIVPDLPEYMRPAEKDRFTFYNILKKRAIFRIRRDIRMVDNYILLTDAMKEWFGYPVKYKVLEGIAGEVFEGLIECNREKKIIYAGGISQAYGVIDLVESFIKVGMPEWELILYGDGIDLQRVKKLAQGCDNVRIMGLVPNDEVVKAQQKASLLVNPRKNQIFTKYSFPSKILEYMSSGTPMIAYKLDGIPDEYDSFYYQISEAENGMESTLRYVMTLTEDERNQMGEKARIFVKTYKNPTSQCMKIVELLSDTKVDSTK